MKPGSSENIAIVLDKLPELKVVFDDIRFPTSFAINSETEAEKEIRKDISRRFRSQTRHTESAPAAKSMTGFVEYDAWQDSPEFKVHLEDVPFVMNASNRVLDETRTNERIFNFITRRRHAAKSILRVLKAMD